MTYYMSIDVSFTGLLFTDNSNKNNKKLLLSICVSLVRRTLHSTLINVCNVSVSCIRFRCKNETAVRTTTRVAVCFYD